MTRAEETEHILRRATPEEVHKSWEVNHEEWGKGLIPELYYKREEHLMSQALTRNGGILHWVLVDTASPDNVLSMCETIRKEALVKYKDGRVEKCTSYAIGCVYTPNHFRGKGYGKEMLGQLGKVLEKMRVEAGGKEIVTSPFSVLYSDIGRDYYSKLGWHPHRAMHAELPQRRLHDDADPNTLPIPIHAKDIRSLCWQDTKHQEVSMRLSPPTEGIEASVKFLCTKEVIDWHHAREEFLHLHLPLEFLEEHVAFEGNPPRPEIKGAMTRSGKQWIIWTRVYADRKLAILRYADIEDGDAPTEEKKKAIKSLLCAAMNEAHNSGLNEVHMWNPSDIIRQCIMEMPLDNPRHSFLRRASIEHRVENSIPCLRWNENPQLDDTKIAWEENEYFGWC